MDLVLDGGSITLIVLGVLAFGGVLTAFFFQFFTDLQPFPFWQILAFGLGCALALMAYLSLVRWLTR